MSNDVDYKRIASDYILVAILGYVAFVILIVFVRYLIYQKIYVPKTLDECLSCVQSQKCCPEGCSSCRKSQNTGRCACCTSEDVGYEESCLDKVPMIGVRCFRPNCSKIACLCCEVFVKNGIVPEDAYAPARNGEGEDGAEDELLQTYRSDVVDGLCKGDAK